MRVFYDAQTFLRQRTGGISRLFTDLIREFDSHPTLEVEPLLPLKLTNNLYLRNDLPHRGMKVTPSWLPRGALYAPWWLAGSRTKSSPEIVHRTYYSSRFLGVEPSVKQVVTVYDMIPELFADSEHFTATHLAKKQYVQECDLVICISESTREDMESIYGDLAKNVKVIPLAVRPEFGQPNDPLEFLPTEYLLYVGARKGYKDFALLPQAMERLMKQGLSIPIVVVGPELNAEERADFHSRGLSNLVIHARLSDVDLQRAYSHCSLLVQTSKYEGFGLTPLEGMASGVPVVAARSSSMPEVGGNVVQYFQAGNSEDLAIVIEKVLQDSALREKLSRQGKERAALFTPFEMATKTADAYFELLC